MMVQIHSAQKDPWNKSLKDYFSCYMGVSLNGGTLKTPQNEHF